MMIFFVGFLVFGCFNLGNLPMIHKIDVLSVFEMVPEHDDKDLKRFISENYIEDEDLRQDASLFLNEVQGSTVLHAIVEYNRVITFKLVCEYLLEKDKLKEALLKKDKYGRGVLPLSFAFSPISFSLAASYVNDMGIEKPQLKELGWKVAREFGDRKMKFNSLVVSVDLLSKGLFGDSSEGYEMFKKNVDRLVSMLDEDFFYECFFTRQSDLYSLLRALMFFEDTKLVRFLWNKLEKKIDPQQLYSAMTEEKDNLIIEAIDYENWEFLNFMLGYIFCLVVEADIEEKSFIERAILSVYKRSSSLRLSELIEGKGLGFLRALLSDLHIWTAVLSKESKLLVDAVGEESAGNPELSLAEKSVAQRSARIPRILRIKGHGTEPPSWSMPKGNLYPKVRTSIVSVEGKIHSSSALRGGDTRGEVARATTLQLSDAKPGETSIASQRAGVALTSAATFRKERLRILSRRSSAEYRSPERLHIYDVPRVELPAVDEERSDEDPTDKECSIISKPDRRIIIYKPRPVQDAEQPKEKR